jgi:transcription initiation factor TFIIB
LEEGEYVCKTCNTLQERFIDASAEWRFYGHDDSKLTDPTRCGMPTNEFLPNMSLGSVLGLENGMTNTMFRIYKYQKWNSMTYRERTLINKFDTLSLKAINGGLPHCIIEEAKSFYKQISEMKISRGENTESMLATSIYMSCKMNKVPRSAKEIAKMFNLNITSMTRGCKRFEEMLKLNMNSSTTPTHFVLRFCSKLNFNQDIAEICTHVVKKEEEYAFTSESAPQSIAAGCLYLVNIVMGLGRTKKDISLACDISEITINKCYKKLVEYREYLFPEGVPVDAPSRSSSVSE